MANPTTNFGWVMPTSASLVTNLPADFNTFGQAVDTSMSELLGGTTGQVLSKTSNTNMDFTWVTPTDQTPLTTKGDLFTFTTVDARLGVGSDGQVLTASAAAATGLAWSTVSSGSVTAIQTITTSGAATNVSFTSIPSTYTNLRIVYQAALTGTTWDDLLMRINGNTGANYDRMQLQGRTGSASAAEAYGQTSIKVGIATETNGSIGQIIVPNYKNTVFDKMAVNYFFAKHGTSSTNQFVGVFGGTLRSTSAVTQIDIFNGSSLAFVNGSTFTLYGES